MSDEPDQRPRTLHEAKAEAMLQEILLLGQANALKLNDTLAHAKQAEIAATEALERTKRLEARFDEAEEQRGLVLEELERGTAEVRRLKRSINQVRRVASTTGTSLEQLREHVMEDSDRLGARVRGLENAGKRDRQRPGRRR